MCLFSCNTHHTIEERKRREDKREDVERSANAAGVQEEKKEAEGDEKIGGEGEGEGEGERGEGTDMH